MLSRKKVGWGNHNFMGSIFNAIRCACLRKPCRLSVFYGQHHYNEQEETAIETEREWTKFWRKIKDSYNKGE